MKTTNKFLAIMAVLLAFGILLPSCNCNVNDKDTAGAISKVKKYRKDQMSEKDILLRSDIIEDTAALTNTIRGMLLFYVYYDAYGKSLKENAEMLKTLPAGTDDQLGAEELESYCEFIENSNEQLCEVCQMFTDIYNDTVTEHSFDVEQNLRNYVIYLDKLDSRDSLVTNAINKSDSWIKVNQMDEKKKDEVNQVKKIRDEILLREVCNAAVTNNQGKIDMYNSYNVYSAIDAVQAVFNVNSFEELNNVFAPKAFENYSAAGEQINSEGQILSGEIYAFQYDIQYVANQMDQFNVTGNIENFVNSLKAFKAYNVESQVHLDAAGSGVNVNSNFVFQDKYVVNSFDVIRNMPNMNDIVHQFFPNLDAAVTVESFVTSNSYQLNQFMSNYVMSSSLVNLSNIDNLSAFK